jgi:hypothetical protein
MSVLFFLYVEAGRSAGKLGGRSKRVVFAQRVAAVDRLRRWRSSGGN